MKHVNVALGELLLFALSIVFFTSTSFAMGGHGNGNGMGVGNGQSGGKGKMAQKEMNHDPFTELKESFPYEEISAAEKEGLLLMREEEKLARDVYAALYEKWGVQIFSNISASEGKHTTAVKALLEKYEITDPVTTDELGVFENEELQKLYDELVAKGSTSLVDALQVGATVEDLDIYDLEQLLSETDNEDITHVYNNLQRGSRNHLRSFNKQLLKNGESSYTAQYLTQDQVDEILAGEQEKGNHKRINNDKYEDDRKQKGEKFRDAKNYKKFDNSKRKSKKSFSDEGKMKNPTAVYELQERGIINGYEDGSFQPEKGISRAESLKILLEATDYSTPEIARETFNDVKKDEWFAGYIENAKSRGFVKGYEDGNFRPHQTVNQAELLKISFEVFGIDLSNYEVTTLPNGVNTDQWYSVYLQYALDNQLLDEDEVKLGKSMTRETFSELVYRLIEQQEGKE